MVTWGSATEKLFKFFWILGDLPINGPLPKINAEVAELADAHGSGPCGSNTMWVQVPSPAKIARPKGWAFFVGDGA